MGMKSSRSRTVVWLAVLAGHLLLVLLLQRAGVWRERGDTAPQRPALVVSLLPAPRPAAAADRPAAITPNRLPARAAAAARRTDPANDATAVAVPDAAALPPDPVVIAPLAPPAAAAARAAPAPLVLDLPRAASSPARRHPGLDDPRANTGGRTLESRIAGAIGGDERLREESLFDGRMRVHEGNACVEVRPNTADQLDPFNRAVRPLPRVAKPC
jgi:hypothetical protein